MPYALARSGVSVISAHTNLDKAYPFGVNHALASALGLGHVRGSSRTAARISHIWASCRSR